MNALEERCGLRERTALVIGGAGGLGRACAAELASAGARVHVADRDPLGIARAWIWRDDRGFPRDSRASLSAEQAES